MLQQGQAPLSNLGMGEMGAPLLRQNPRLPVKARRQLPRHSLSGPLPRPTSFPPK